MIGGCVDHSMTSPLKTSKAEPCKGQMTVSNDVRASAQGRANVRAVVLDDEYFAPFRLSYKAVGACDFDRLELPGCQVARFDARLRPDEGREDRGRRVLGSGFPRRRWRIKIRRRLAAEPSLAVRVEEVAPKWHASRDGVRDADGGHADHRQPTVLELLELRRLHISRLPELQGVPTEVTGLAVALADPHVPGIVEALAEGDEDPDLNHAELGSPVGVARVQGCPEVVRYRVTGDAGAESLEDKADKSQHADAPVLDLGFAQPLHVGVGH